MKSSLVRLLACRRRCGSTMHDSLTIPSGTVRRQVLMLEQEFFAVDDGPGDVFQCSGSVFIGGDVLQ